MRRIRSTGWDAHGTERLTIGREEYVWCANGHLLRFSSSDWAMLGVATDRTDAEARIEADLNARAVCAAIEGPGVSKCDHSGRFLAGHKVFWKPETFKEENVGLVFADKLKGGT